MLTGGVALGRVCSCRFLLLCNRLVLSDIKAIHCHMVTASGVGIGWGRAWGRGVVWERVASLLG